MGIEFFQSLPDLRKSVIYIAYKPGHTSDIPFYDLFRNREKIGFKAIARLVKDLEDQDFLLLLLDFSDRRSREPDPLDFDELDEIVKWYQEQKEEYNINKETIQPIIMGRDLLKLGVEPGVQMGEYLNQLYERQLDGEFDTKEEGLKLFEKIRKQ